MKLKPYPKYKDSGVEWLGKIPEEWEVKRLKHILNLRSGESPIKEQNGKFHIYGANGLIGSTNRFNIIKDSIIIGRVGSSGSINIAPSKSWISDNALIVDFKESSTNFRYIFYLLSGVNFKYLVNKNAQPLITSTQIKNLYAAVPQIEFQTQIAKYLDQKTTKIDELIKKNEKLIELLKEKRQAIISQAVTKGLYTPLTPLKRGIKNAKMKNSVIEWLGEIPEGWELKRLKHVAHINQETLKENTNGDYEMKYVDISNVGVEGLINEPETILFGNAPSRARRRINRDDVIVSTVRTYLKAIAYFQNPDSNLIVSTGFAVLTALDIVLPKFLYYFVRSDLSVEKIMANSVGVSYPAINSSVLARLTFLLPEKNEQCAIVVFLDRETNKIEKLIKKIIDQNEKLKEFRQSLISNIVTGKLNVCN